MLNAPVKILQTIQIETDQASVTFSNIDDLVAAWDARQHITSRHLVILINAAASDAADRWIAFRLNGDGGNNYSSQEIRGTAAAAAASRYDSTSYAHSGLFNGTNIANAYSGGILIFPHAFNTSNQKAFLSLTGSLETTVQVTTGRWSNVNAITSIEVYANSGNMQAGSTFHLGVVDERYLVEEVDLAGGAGLPVFDNIPQGEGNLAVVGYCRSDRVGVTDSINININEDSINANYYNQQLRGVGAAVSSVSQNNRIIGDCPAVNATASVYGSLISIVSQYTKANQPHLFNITGFHESSAPTGVIDLRSGRRDNSEPINKLSYEPNNGTDFKAGSLFSLYRVPKRIIERVELTEDTATVTFDNISQNFEALQINVYARSDKAALDDDIAITINGDAVVANYDRQRLYGSGAVVTSDRNLAIQDWLKCPAANEGVGEFGGGLFIFPSYAETDRHKHCISFHGRQENIVVVQSNRWESLNAITRIDLALVTGPNFVAGSVFELEGIFRKEGLPPDEGEQWGV